MTLYLYYPSWSNDSTVVYTNAPTLEELKFNIVKYYAVAIPLSMLDRHFYSRKPYQGKWERDICLDKYGALLLASEKIVELVNAFPD